VHKRLFTAIEEGYVHQQGLVGYGNAVCATDPAAPARREHAVDPWGTAYWIHLRRADGAIRLVVYSFGPNRRRDGTPGTGQGDDLAASIDITM
jgi:hypothetical protein